MMSLFSVFDPVSYLGFTLNWVVLCMVLVVVPCKSYLVNGGEVFLGEEFMKSMGGVFKEVSSPNGSAIVLLSLGAFLYLIVSNLLGLFPFVFTATAHPAVVMGWGLVLWISFFVMGWVSNFKMSAAHLVPEGSPLFLSPLMVLIESISHLMRPFTLSIRLVANMMAGHLILGLLASISLLDVYGFVCSLIFQSILMVLEIGVALIQGVVFSILVLLYLLEYY